MKQSTRYQRPSQQTQKSEQASRTIQLAASRGRDKRGDLLATIRGQNPFLEALEAKKAFEKETEKTEMSLLALSVDEALALEQQIGEHDEIELDSGDRHIIQVEKETCPVCFHIALSQNGNSIVCSNCVLKVPVPAGMSLKDFTPFLVSHLDEHANHCSGSMSFSYQQDIGLFSTCTCCDSIGFIA